MNIKATFVIVAMVAIHHVIAIPVLNHGHSDTKNRVVKRRIRTDILILAGYAAVQGALLWNYNLAKKKENECKPCPPDVEDEQTCESILEKRDIVGVEVGGIRIPGSIVTKTGSVDERKSDSENI